MGQIAAADGYYHAKEYSHALGRENFSEKADYESFINEQTALLLDDKIALVIDKIHQITPNSKVSHKSIIEYYTNNGKRMMYENLSNTRLCH